MNINMFESFVISFAVWTVLSCTGMLFVLRNSFTIALRIFQVGLYCISAPAPVEIGHFSKTGSNPPPVKILAGYPDFAAFDKKCYAARQCSLVDISEIQFKAN